MLLIYRAINRKMFQRLCYSEIFNTRLVQAKRAAVVDVTDTRLAVPDPDWDRQAKVAQVAKVAKVVQVLQVVQVVLHDQAEMYKHK